MSVAKVKPIPGASTVPVAGKRERVITLSIALGKPFPPVLGVEMITFKHKDGRNPRAVESAPGNMIGCLVIELLIKDLGLDTSDGIVDVTIDDDLRERAKNRFRDEWVNPSEPGDEAIILAIQECDSMTVDFREE